MNILSIENLSKSYGSKDLFKNISFGIDELDKIGLIGKNGQGKTSFLKIIAGLEEGDSGDITRASQLRVEYLPQNVDFSQGGRVLDQVFRGNSKNMKLLRAYQEELSKEVMDNERIMELTDQMDRENIWELESEAKAVLSKLGVGDYKKDINQLSGGQKRRVALASALINDADLLILDEPTNHLDNKTIEWLEGYLKNRKGALLMVTHDRYFLDRVTSKIIELDAGQLYSYDGNYKYYLEKKADREESILASERKRQSLYREELAWMRQGIKARGTRAKARIERFEDLRDNKLEINNSSLDISVSGQRLGNKIIEARNVSKSYNNKPIIQDFTYTVLRDDRIGILGDNGAGKSTLMNILTGKIQPDSGTIERGETLKLAYFSQESVDMDLGLRALDYIKQGGEFVETSDGARITASQMMERFLFTGKEQYTEIEKLSGGERRRLYLLRILMTGPNMLILDEPTNDLDIGTLSILEDYIDDFPGPVVVVSHDRYLLDRLVEKVFHIDKGKVTEYPGSYSLFRRKMEERQALEELEEKTQEAKEVSPEKNRPRQEKKTKFSYNEKREWESIDHDIASLEEKIQNLELAMEENASDYSKLEDLAREKEDLDRQLEEKMDRWVYLSELKEEIDENNK